MADVPPWARPLDAPSTPAWARPLNEGDVAPPIALEQEPPVTLGAGSTGAVHAMRHLAFGLGDKILAAEEALSEKLHDKTGQTSFPEAYSRNLAYNDKLLEDSDKAHPKARWVGNAFGLAGNAAALAAVAPARAALAARELVPAAEAAPASLSTLGRIFQGAKEGGKLGTVFGGVGGFGGSRSDTLGGTALDTGLGSVAGLALGTPLGALGGALAGKLASRASPQVQDVRPLEGVKGMPLLAKEVAPTREAQVLQKYGVPLTLGQMQPGSIASEAEEASLRVPVLGQRVLAQREAAKKAWEAALLNEARPPVPGAISSPENLPAALQRMKQGFTQVYGEIGQHPAPIGAIHPQTGELVNPRVAFKAILDDPDYLATPDDLRVVHRAMANQIGKLHSVAKDGGPIKSEVLMSMREDLRELAQRARLAGKTEQGVMFQDAADSIGGGLEHGLPPEQLARLKETDAAYSRYMKVLGAVQRAPDKPAGITPNSMSQELARSYGRKYPEDPNAGGSIRELTRAALHTLPEQTPRTGHGEALKSAFGYALGPMVLRANESPEAQAAFMQAAKNLASSSPRLLPPAAGEVERALARGYNLLPPGTAGAQLSPDVAAMVAALRGRGNQ